MTSVAYEDPAEMRTEYDLIMQWLARPELSASERRILTLERDNLAPQLNMDRERVASERHAARVRSALTADPEAADALANLARTIQSITGEPDNPELFYIYHQGERIAISREQAEGLRTNLWSQLRRAINRIDSNATYYWERYNSQLAINRDSPIIADITGWLADVEDPGDELASRYFRLRHRVRIVLDHLEAGRMVEAAAIIPSVEPIGQEIRSLARAFYEGHIEGAEMAIRGLTITRDVSFAIAGSIAAVVAAPVVAGVVGTGGLGLTGASATVATIGGTGLVVGTGTAVVRGTSSAAGTLAAGGSWHEAGEAFTSEAATGFREGFLAGAGGAAARSLGLAIGVGGSLTRQAAMRVGGEMLINGTTAMVDSLWRSCRSPQGCDVGQAAQTAVIAAAQAAPGALIGGSSNPVVRNLVAPFTAAGTSYLAARASGLSSEEALTQAGVALAANIAMTRAIHGSEVDAALVERGRSIGARVREGTASTARTARAYVTATTIGVADALPPARSGYGGTSIVDLSDVPAISSPRRAAAPTEPPIDTTTEPLPPATLTPRSDTDIPTSAAATIPAGPVDAPVASSRPRIYHADSESEGGGVFSEPPAPTVETVRRPRATAAESRPASETTASDVRAGAPRRLADESGLTLSEREMLIDAIDSGDLSGLPPDLRRRAEIAEIHSESSGTVFDETEPASIRGDVDATTSESTTPSERLRASLEAEGIHVPDGHDAHHIIASRGGGEAGDRARRVLEAAGIGPDTAQNGVPLPRTTTDPTTVPEGLSRHQVLHTRPYYEAVADILEGVPRTDLPRAATDRLARIDIDNVEARLAVIRELITEGRFPH